MSISRIPESAFRETKEAVRVTAVISDPIQSQNPESAFREEEIIK
jgi:hypothetical protein